MIAHASSCQELSISEANAATVEGKSEATEAMPERIIMGEHHR
jgi:hypothetical protein